jgi:hypothetical protein
MATDPNAQKVIDTCMSDWDANKDDCNKFVKAVAGDLGVSIPADSDADGIVDFLAGSGDWHELTAGDGPGAKQAADSGAFVIGGLKSDELVPSQDHGHVLVVLSGDLDPTHNQYPRASWGRLGGGGQKDSFVNFSFNSTSRDKVRYFTRSLS